MQCPNCGRQKSDGARFCPACGKNVPAGAPAQQQRQQQYAQQQYAQQVPRQANQYQQRCSYQQTQMVSPSQAQQAQARQAQARQPQVRPVQAQQGQRYYPNMQQPQPRMQQPVMQQPAMQPAMQPQVQPYAGGEEGKGFAIASLVLGILGMLGSLILYPLFDVPALILIFCLVFGVAGIVTAFLARSRGYKNALSMAGLVCSILATLASVIFLMFLYVVVWFNAVADEA